MAPGCVHLTEAAVQTHLGPRGGRLPMFEKMCAQRGARTHDPEIKSLMLYRLS